MVMTIHFHFSAVEEDFHCFNFLKCTDPFNRGFVCKSKNWLENVLCNIILYTYIITSCNIIEVFFMWSTYQHIKESTESAKALIGRQHYQKRKK